VNLCGSKFKIELLPDKYIEIMKTSTKQTEENSQIKFEKRNTLKRTIWNSRRHYSYLTQYKINN
jgi:hypothetical protein